MTDDTDKPRPIDPAALAAAAPRAWGLITAFATSDDVDPSAAVDALLSDIAPDDWPALFFTLVSQAGLLVNLSVTQIIESTKGAYRMCLAVDGVAAEQFDTFWRYTMEPTFDRAKIRDTILQGVGSSIPNIKWGGDGPPAGKD